MKRPVIRDAMGISEGSWPGFLNADIMTFGDQVLSCRRLSCTQSCSYIISGFYPLDAGSTLPIP